ncbi:unnamed protein product [Brassica napus]|uniref:(rape) hypothetical protein n=1 Tax=Brassica napus TaxID=3708 RepID=A0A816LYK6_BRANA|nr:unnamed protein product [Brassica napus]
MHPSCAQVSPKSILAGALTPEKSFRSQLCPRVSWQLG